MITESLFGSKFWAEIRLILAHWGFKDEWINVGEVFHVHKNWNQTKLGAQIRQTTQSSSVNIAQWSEVENSIWKYILHSSSLHCCKNELNFWFLKFLRTPLRFFHKICLFQGLKSDDSNSTLAVRSPKFGQAKTHFLSHHKVYYINRFADFLTRDQWSNG